jgi:putative ABC transport system permease protein
VHDLRDAIRALRRTPLVTIVAILSLALGIGANTAMFSIVDALLLRALPVQAPERLARLDGFSITNPIWEQIRDRPQLFGGAFAWSRTGFNLASGGEIDEVDGLWASGDFFTVLGVRPIIGRAFTAADDRRDGGPDGPVAVISYAYWQRRYGGDRGVIGRTVTLSRTPFTIIGVAPPGFFGPEVGSTFDVVVPLATEAIVRGRESSLDQRSHWWLEFVVRLRDGQTIEQARAALAAVQPQIAAATIPPHYRPQDRSQYLSNPLRLAPAATGSSDLRREYRTPLLTLMAIVGLVLLVACGNIANLQLARATARRHELSVRSALGATRGRLGRQLLGESLLLAGAGALLGVAVAWGGSRALVRLLSTAESPVYLQLPLDGRVLGFTVGAAVVTALLFGTLPALRAARAQPIDAMKEHGRGTTSERRMGLAGSLVVAQVALSLVLLVGAGLFVRTFTSLASVRLGFDASGVLIASVGTRRAAADSNTRHALYERLRAAARAVPGVSAAALSQITPVEGGYWNTRVIIQGIQPLPEEQAESGMNALSDGWFATYRTPLLGGRDFGAGDVRGAPKVAIVNQAFARKFLNGANPIGRVIVDEGRPGTPPSQTVIVGLVGDAIYRGIRDSLQPTAYIPLAQNVLPGSSVSISVRTTGDPAALTQAMTRALTAVDPNVTVSYRTLVDQIGDSLARERLVALLSTFFGGLALLLAGIGLYGVAAYSVSRRRVEMGIRMALGTTPSGIVKLVMSRVAGQVALGVVIGGLASWWAARFVASLLYGLRPHDPATIAAAVTVLGLVGLAAAWVPARRASRVDPATVLREG